MTIFNATILQPRILGIICAISAVMLGITHMAIAGAPMRYLGVNVCALAIGLIILVLLDRSVAARQRRMIGASIAMAGALLATTLFGSEVDGVARWVNFGALAIQPSLILLPVMLVAFSRTICALLTASIITASVAMMLQPDRAMAGMLALCLTTLAILRPDRHVGLALAASVIGFGITLARANTLPAVPYVDQILYSSFEVHAVAGLAVLIGMALLLVPAIVGWSRDSANRTTYAVFGAVWSAAIMLQRLATIRRRSLVMVAAPS